MERETLVYADQIVWLLRDALYSGRDGLQGVPAMLKKVIMEGLWRERVVRETGEIVHFDSFEEFVKAAPLEGLGADLRLIKRLAGDDPELLDAIDREMVAQSKQGERTDLKGDLLYNIQEVKQESAPTGTSAQAALRRLRKSRPDLHKRVIEGEMSPHAAMLEAGFRPKTATIYPEDARRTASTLVRNCDKETLRAIRDALNEYLGE